MVDNQFNRVGTIRIHKDGQNTKKSPQIVTLKLIATIGMLAIGFVIVIPSIPLAPLQSFAIAFGILMIYVGVAYFIRPEPNTDNMGRGFGGNDRGQIGDNINRELANLHMMLGPGRFVSETFIDAATLFGLLPERTQEQIDHEQESLEIEAAATRQQEIEAKIAARQEAQEHKGNVELSSAKYFATPTPEEAAEPTDSMQESEC